MSRRRKERQRAEAHARSRRRLALAAGGALLFGIGSFVLLRGGEGGGAVAVPPDLPPYAAPVRGSASASVTIVEYGDFQCPSCGAFFRSVEPQIIRRYVDTGQAKLVFKHFAWIGQESRDAGLASACAHAQGRFWEYHDLLYARQRGENNGAFGPGNLKRFASELGLDRGAFDRCYDSGAYRGALDRDFQESRAIGATGTPTFLINGQRVVGAQPFAVFARVIEQKLGGG